MAAPTITVNGVPTTPIAPGTTVDMTVVATDPDSRTVTLLFTYTDSTGATGSATKTIQVVDVGTCVASIVSGGGSLTQTGPLAFRFVA